MFSDLLNHKEGRDLFPMGRNSALKPVMHTQKTPQTRKEFTSNSVAGRKQVREK